MTSGSSCSVPTSNRRRSTLAVTAFFQILSVFLDHRRTRPRNNDALLRPFLDRVKRSKLILFQELPLVKILDLYNGRYSPYNFEKGEPNRKWIKKKKREE